MKSTKVPFTAKHGLINTGFLRCKMLIIYIFRTQYKRRLKVVQMRCKRGAKSSTKFFGKYGGS